MSWGFSRHGGGNAASMPMSGKLTGRHMQNAANEHARKGGGVSKDRTRPGKTKAGDPKKPRR